jgi:hypothetical protein
MVAFHSNSANPEQLSGSLILSPFTAPWGIRYFPEHFGLWRVNTVTIRQWSRWILLAASLAIASPAFALTLGDLNAGASFTTDGLTFSEFDIHASDGLLLNEIEIEILPNGFQYAVVVGPNLDSAGSASSAYVSELRRSDHEEGGQEEGGPEEEGRLLQHLREQQQCRLRAVRSIG